MTFKPTQDIIDILKKAGSPDKDDAIRARTTIVEALQLSLKHNIIKESGCCEAAIDYDCKDKLIQFVQIKAMHCREARWDIVGYAFNRAEDTIIERIKNHGAKIIGEVVLTLLEYDEKSFDISIGVSCNKASNTGM